MHIRVGDKKALWCIWRSCTVIDILWYYFYCWYFSRHDIYSKVNYCCIVNDANTFVYQKALNKHLNLVFWLQNNFCEFTTHLGNSNGYFVNKKPGLKIFDMLKLVRLIFGNAKSIDMHLWIKISQTQHESLTYDMTQLHSLTISEF